MSLNNLQTGIIAISDARLEMSLQKNRTTCVSFGCVILDIHTKQVLEIQKFGKCFNQEKTYFQHTAIIEYLGGVIALKRAQKHQKFPTQKILLGIDEASALLFLMGERPQGKNNYHQTLTQVIERAKISPEISQNVFGCILSKRKNRKYIEDEISNKLKGERKRFIQANQIGTELRSICETAHSVCHHMATLEGYNMLEKSNDLIDEINTKANSKIWLLNEKIRNIPIIS